MLSLFAVDDGRTGVLAEGEHSLDRRFRVAQELEGDVFVVVAGFGVGQDGGHLLVVGAAEHELAVVEGLLGDQRERLGGDFQDGLLAETGCFYEFFRPGDLVILSRVGTELEHGCVFEFSHKRVSFSYPQR